MICVPTPFLEGEGVPQPDLKYVEAAVRSIASLVKPGDLVVLESTCPVGTTERVRDMLGAGGTDLSQVQIAYCPERVLPGRIMTELVQNDRVVGGLTPLASQAVGDFYRTFVRGVVLQTDARTAEMCKLVENSFRDVNIAFANELSLICAREGIDVWSLIELANRHPRVNILQPGAGVGGHCIAVDPWFVIARDPENARLIRSARDVNNRKTSWVIEQVGLKIADFAQRTGRPPRVACLGLAFKPDIDDLRESPSVHIAQVLLRQGHDIVAVEPNIKTHSEFQLLSLDEALSTSDILVGLVKHRQFVDPALRGALASACMLDYCGMLG